MSVPAEPNLDALREATIKLRVAKGLTVDDLHQQSGVGRSTLFRIENGSVAGSLTTWYRIAKALGVPLSELVTRLEDPAATDPSATR